MVGLTGGIGSGKSTVAAMFEKLGAAVIDADALAREVVAPGKPALHEIETRFGAGVIRRDGTLDRAALADIVFRDPGARQDLESITHPRIAQRASELLGRFHREGKLVVIYEAALMVEKRIHESLDGLIVVATSPDKQIERVMKRGSANESEVKRRLKTQLPLEDKAKAADWVVDNDGSLEETWEQVTKVWETLRDAAKKEDDQETPGR